MSVASISQWRDGTFEPLEHCEVIEQTIAVADSWLVRDATALAIAEHRARFLEAAPGERGEAARFWDAVIAAIPAQGDWFPRVEAHDTGGRPRFVLRLRTAPQRRRSAVLATWRGPDPRTAPAVKGPDLPALVGIRTRTQSAGADDAVLLTPDGFVVDGSTSALLWWRGEILCGPPSGAADPAFARVSSVTSRSILTLARALGHDTHEEAVTPAELGGTELWVVNALHGIRIVTRWIDGPQLAELPGRLGSWRARLDALRRPIR